MTPIQFGKIIRIRREELGLHQGELATRAGVTRVTICNIESGKHAPRLEIATKILKALRLTMEVMPE